MSFFGDGGYIYGFWDRIKLMGMVLISHHCSICLNQCISNACCGGGQNVQKAHGPKARGYKSKKKKKEKLGSSPRYIVIKEVSGALRKDEVKRSCWATKPGLLMILVPA